MQICRRQATTLTAHPRLSRRAGVEVALRSVEWGKHIQMNRLEWLRCIIEVCD